MSLEYAQARIQSRLGDRPNEALWAELSSARAFAAYLEAVRGSRMRAWVAGIGAASDLHQVDGNLHDRFREHIREVARWMPAEWRPAVLWLLRLFDLAAIGHLLAGRAPLPWMSRDEGLRAVLAAQSPSDMLLAVRVLVNTRAQHGATVAAGSGISPARLRAAWRAEWIRRWPPGERRGSCGVRSVLETFEQHLVRFGASGVAGSWRERALLEYALRKLFCRLTLDAGACFAYLGLVALDLERLRAELVRRAVGLPLREAA